MNRTRASQVAFTSGLLAVAAGAGAGMYWAWAKNQNQLGIGEPVPWVPMWGLAAVAVVAGLVALVVGLSSSLTGPDRT